MALLAILGALLTGLTLTLVGAGGYLLALLAGGRPDDSGDSPQDPLTLAISALLLATVEAVAVALTLGVLEVLRLEVALGVQALLVYGLYRGALRRGWTQATLGKPLRRIVGRAGARLLENPVLSLVALHAAGVETLRGLIRPPLSWDSLMYHLFLAATWLQRGSLDLVAASHPTTFYQFAPANGSLWLWWWMAPSHSELYASLAFLPQWILLGLAAGGVARELGARRRWPVAGFLTLLAPTVVRFLPTQYVDIATGAALAAGTFFAIRWWQSAASRDATLLGLSAGLAAGTKILGIPFAAALGGLAALLARGNWRRRWYQLAGAAVVAALLGGYFYARNLSYGGGLFAFACAKRQPAADGFPGGFPSPDSPMARLPELLANHELAGAFLGKVHPVMSDLGIGPVVLILVVALFALPFVFRGRPRRVAWLVSAQLAVQLALWMTVTHATGSHILANVRYFTGGLALAFAGAVAIGEKRLSDPWLRGLAIAVAIQDLLMLDARMPLGIRVTMAAALAAAAAFGMSGRLRALLVARRRPLAAALALLLLALTPSFASFRVRDRERAFAHDYVGHLSTTRLFAAGWGWLDENAGNGTVAVSHAPENFFVYPAMGPFLERRAVYVNVNEANHSNPLLYPACRDRVDPSPDAWIEHLRSEGVVWLYVARYPGFDFPMEDAWAQERPGLFRLRFEDPTNRVYEVAPPGGSSAPQPADGSAARAPRSTS